MNKKLPSFLLLLATSCLLSTFLWAENPFVIQSSIDWSEGSLSLDITACSSTRSAPGERYRTQQSIERSFSQILSETLFKIPLNSSNTIGSYTTENPSFQIYIEDTAENITKAYARPSPDLKDLTIHYQIDLFPTISRGFSFGEEGYPAPVLIPWSPGAEFTGIVIYIEGELPLHGTNRDVQLQPALFPRLFSENMEILCEAEMIPSEILYENGVFAYTDSFNEVPWTERIGFFPFRISAKEIYGENHTDIIISEEDSRIILANPVSRNLLETGKILVICPETNQILSEGI